MKYSRFEELPVWQAAATFFVAIDQFSQAPFFKGRSSLRAQLERAALSISNNIAEGFERGTNADLLNFIYIAKGSAGEVRSILSVIARMPEAAGLGSAISSLREKVEGISRQLGAWAESIKNLNNKGIRYVSDKTRKQDKQQREQREYWKEQREEHERRLGQRRTNGGT